MATKLTNLYTGWKYNPDQDLVAERLDLLMRGRTWSREKMKEYQWERTRVILELAYNHSPYYGRLLAELGLSPSDFTSLDDLDRLPLLDKATIKKYHDDFLVNTVDRDELFTITSGGSTGDPLKLYYDERFNARDRANTFFYLRLNNHNPLTSRSVRLHGDPIPEENIVDESYSFPVGENKLILSSQHIGPETCGTYIRQINEFRPEYIHAYPSAIYGLASAMQETGERLAISLDCIYCDSEMLYPGQKLLIESVLGCRVFVTYGHTEGAIIAVSCPDCDALHVLPQVGYTEIIKDDGSPARNPGDTGEIVVSGFNNEVFPLIRYRTSDIAVLAEPCPDCRLGYMAFSHIEGRSQDFAVAADGTSVPVAPGLFDYNVDWSGVARFQLIQEEPGVLQLNLQLEASDRIIFSDVASRLKEQLGSVFGDRFRLIPKQVDEILPTTRGKHRYFVQNLPR